MDTLLKLVRRGEGKDRDNETHDDGRFKVACNVMLLMKVDENGNMFTLRFTRGSNPGPQKFYLYQRPTEVIHGQFY
jgi:hypothetical protein